MSWVQYSVLPVLVATAPDGVLYVNLSEVAWIGFLLGLLDQNITAKLEKELRDA